MSVLYRCNPLQTYTSLPVLDKQVYSFFYDSKRKKRTRTEDLAAASLDEYVRSTMDACERNPRGMTSLFHDTPRLAFFVLTARSGKYRQKLASCPKMCPPAVLESAIEVLDNVYDLDYFSERVVQIGITAFKRSDSKLLLQTVLNMLGAIRSGVEDACELLFWYLSADPDGQLWPSHETTQSDRRGMGVYLTWLCKRAALLSGVVLNTRSIYSYFNSLRLVKLLCKPGVHATHQTRFRELFMAHVVPRIHDMFQALDIAEWIGENWDGVCSPAAYRSAACAMAETGNITCAYVLHAIDQLLPNYPHESRAHKWLATGVSIVGEFYTESQRTDVTERLLQSLAKHIDQAIFTYIRRCSPSRDFIEFVYCCPNSLFSRSDALATIALYRSRCDDKHKRLLPQPEETGMEDIFPKICTDAMRDALWQYMQSVGFKITSPAAGAATCMVCMDDDIRKQMVRTPCCSQLHHLCCGIDLWKNWRPRCIACQRSFDCGEDISESGSA